MKAEVKKGTTSIQVDEPPFELKNDSAATKKLSHANKVGSGKIRTSSNLEAKSLVQDEGPEYNSMLITKRTSRRAVAVKETGRVHKTDKKSSRVISGMRKVKAATKKK